MLKVAKGDIPRGGVSFDAGAVAAGVEGEAGALALSSALLMPGGNQWGRVRVGKRAVRVVRARRRWSSEGLVSM